MIRCARRGRGCPSRRQRLLTHVRNTTMTGALGQAANALQPRQLRSTAPAARRCRCRAPPRSARRGARRVAEHVIGGMAGHVDHRRNEALRDRIRRNTSFTSHTENHTVCLGGIGPGARRPAARSPRCAFVPPMGSPRLTCLRPCDTTGFRLRCVGAFKTPSCMPSSPSFGPFRHPRTGAPHRGPPTSRRVVSV